MMSVVRDFGKLERNILLYSGREAALRGVLTLPDQRKANMRRGEERTSRGKYAAVGRKNK